MAPRAGASDALLPADVRDEPFVVEPVAAAFAGRVFHAQHECGQQQARRAGDEERCAPAEMVAHQTADDIAQRGPHRNRHVEYRQDAAALRA
jgi:hypothetical protein